MGSLRSVAEMDFGVHGPASAALLSVGVQSTSIMTTTEILDSVVACARRTLVTSSCDPIAVTDLMVVSDSISELATPGAGTRAGRNALLSRLHEIGVSKARVHGIAMGGSNNMMHALSLASDCVMARREASVLLVAVDVFACDQDRFMSSALAVSGDAVASCLVASDQFDEHGGFALDALSVLPYAPIQGRPTAQLALDMYSTLKACIADCYGASGTDPADVAAVIVGNYNTPTATLFARLAGVDPTRLVLAHTETHGHAPSSDFLSNLETLDAAPGKATILAAFNGPTSCGAALLSRIGT